jgi:HTH-type transcriptional regulator/antitoxin HigA
MKAELIIIQSETDYAAALALIDGLMESSAPADVGRLRAQARLVEAWEAERRPLRMVDPVEAIKFRMDQMGMTRADLAKLLGGRSKVSEVLNRKRPLSLAMIRRLHRQLDIPADVLISRAA